MSVFHPWGRHWRGGIVFLALILIILAVWGWMQ
jgi:hypothetical protein